MTGPRIDSGVPTLSAMAIMLAVPPIQLPDSAAKPVHASSGRNAPKIANETAPPRMMPTVPTSIMASAMGPSLRMLRRSTVIMSSSSATGRRNRTIQP
jgi:hypothetical protein